MPIAVCCQNCGRDFSVTDAWAGKRIKCPKCKRPLKIPGRPAEFDLVDDVLDGFDAKPSAPPAQPKPQPRPKPQAQPQGSLEFIDEIEEVLPSRQVKPTPVAPTPSRPKPKPQAPAMLEFVDDGELASAIPVAEIVQPTTPVVPQEETYGLAGDPDRLSDDLLADFPMPAASDPLGPAPPRRRKRSRQHSRSSSVSIEIDFKGMLLRSRTALVVAFVTPFSVLYLLVGGHLLTAFIGAAIGSLLVFFGMCTEKREVDSSEWRLDMVVILLFFIISPVAAFTCVLVRVYGFFRVFAGYHVIGCLIVPMLMTLLTMGEGFDTRSRSSSSFDEMDYEDQEVEHDPAAYWRDPLEDSSFENRPERPGRYRPRESRDPYR